MIRPEPVLPNDANFIEAIDKTDRAFIDWIKPLAAALPPACLAPELEVSEAVLIYAKVNLGISFCRWPDSSYKRTNLKWERASEQDKFRMLAQALAAYRGRKRVVATALGLRYHELREWLESAAGRRFILDGKEDAGQRAAYCMGVRLVDQLGLVEARRQRTLEMSERHDQWAQEAEPFNSAYAYAKAYNLCPTTALRRFRLIGRAVNRDILESHTRRVELAREIIETRPEADWNHSQIVWWSTHFYHTSTPAPHQRAAISRVLREVGLIPYRQPGSHIVKWTRPQDLTQEQAERIVMTGV